MTDSKISALAARSQNFGYLLSDKVLPHEQLLVEFGARAELVVFADPNSALVKARQFVETLAREMVRFLALKPQDSLQLRVKALSTAGALPADRFEDFDRVRVLGNRAVHEGFADRGAALECLRRCFELGAWYHRTVYAEAVRRTFVPPEPPPNPTRELRAELDRLRTELEQASLSLAGGASREQALKDAQRTAEAQIATAVADRAAAFALAADLEQQLVALKTSYERQDAAAGPARLSAMDRDVRIERARRPAPLTEAETRIVIDGMLRAAGWSVQDAGSMDLYVAQGVAVREVRLADGVADYLLYVDRKIVGVVEAKREGASLAAVEWQSDRYATGLDSGQRLAAWRVPLPFRYESTGVETWFTNGVDPQRRARRVFSFHRPETVSRWMREAEERPEAPTLRARLRRLPPLDETGLRPAQVKAVQGLEASLAADRARGLIQMATGAGKTYAAVTASYRLLKHAGAQRILFLVDRNNLGRQAAEEFGAYRTPDDGRKLTELYNVQRLSGSAMLGSSKVVISTIQRLYRVLSGAEVPPPDDDDRAYDDYDRDEPVEVAYSADLPPETFDLIVVDECHRSIYGLWRAVLEYFDAYVVGLTATPVAQTFGFFHQNLLSSYTYQEAVADGVNVDFDVFRIRTELTEHGATIDAQTVVPVRDRRTRRQRYLELDDDYTYEASQVGRSVISEGQLRLVLQAFRDRLFTEIFPGRTVVPKTLIIAKDDNHAEDVVRMVREVFDAGNDFATKITYRAEDPHRLLQAFRTTPELRVAVTVDMIATGTDVRPLECVLFLREVKSWSLFEQMKGRGARTLDEAEFRAVTPDAIRKDRFVIVDAVGVTDSPRVDAAPLQRHSERQISLEQLLRKAGALTLTEDEVSTLASRLARLNQQITPAERAELEGVAGQSLVSITHGLVESVDQDAQENARTSGGRAAQRALIERGLRPLAANPELRERLLEIRRQHDIYYDEVNPDRLISAEGVTFSAANPKHLVESWQAWLREHQAEVDALQVAFSDPSRDPHVVYGLVKEIADRIARPPQRWTPRDLWNAYAALGKAPRNGRRGVTDLVSILRYELGVDAEIAPFRSRVEERFAAWLARQTQSGVSFTPDQRWWLDRMVTVIVSSAGISGDDLDDVPFSEHGGTTGFWHAFGDRAESLLTELNRELTA